MDLDGSRTAVGDRCAIECKHAVGSLIEKFRLWFYDPAAQRWLPTAQEAHQEAISALERSEASRRQAEAEAERLRQELASLRRQKQGNRELAKTFLTQRREDAKGGKRNEVSCGSAHSMLSSRPRFSLRLCGFASDNITKTCGCLCSSSLTISARSCTLFPVFHSLGRKHK
jgi:hypothetical protein